VALGRVPVRAASVGFIALIGIAVLNGVVLISYVNRLIAEEGLGLHAAVMEGARRRMTPVTLTAAIAAIALVPFLFATGPGAEIQRPLAVVVIGGLVTATVLTLVLLPILYDRFALPPAARAELEAEEELLEDPEEEERWARRMARRRAAEQAAAAAAEDSQLAGGGPDPRAPPRAERPGAEEHAAALPPAPGRGGAAAASPPGPKAPPAAGDAAAPLGTGADRPEPPVRRPQAAK
jgi:hypothetical protein